jgi:glutathionylspermidine synthase
MVGKDHSARLADSRFEDAKVPKKKKLPQSLHWFHEQEYFTDEVLSVNVHEIEQYTKIAEEAYQLFVQATDLAIEENRLISFGIPANFHAFFKHSWENRDNVPYLYGRMDVNGVINRLPGKVIEFNADTCSTLPETMLYQKMQLEGMGGKEYHQFNYLEESLALMFSRLKNHLNVDYKPTVLGTALGYPEDVENVKMILKVAGDQGFHPIYSNLEEVIFSEEEGIFIDAGNESIPIDILFKFFPWDWAIEEEPELAQILATIVMNGKCIILNPFYTMLWQNKKFLTYITEKFPDNQVIAQSFNDRKGYGGYVAKPVLGRIGENVRMVKPDGKEVITTGDYANQPMIYQEFVQNPVDEENYTYQAGVFTVGHKAVALNYRCSEKEIINDDCEFITHFID